MDLLKYCFSILLLRIDENKQVLVTCNICLEQYTSREKNIYMNIFEICFPTLWKWNPVMVFLVLVLFFLNFSVWWISMTYVATVCFIFSSSCISFEKDWKFEICKTKHVNRRNINVYMKLEYVGGLLCIVS